MAYYSMKLKLLLFEDAVINDQLDQLVVRNIILDVISVIKGPLGFISEAKITELLNSIIQAIKTVEFKAIIQTKEFQELYCIAESYAVSKFDYIAKVTEKQESLAKTLLNNIGRTREWKKFIDLDLVRKIRKKHQFLSVLHAFLMEDIEARFHFQHKYENCHYEINPFIPFTSSVDFNVCDKNFEIDLTCFSDKVIRLYLGENLKYDNFKNIIIYETIKLSKEVIDIKFLEENEYWLVFLCLTSLYDFIYKKESALFNYYFKQREQNNRIYQSFVQRSSSQRIAAEDLFLFCVLAGARVKDMRNFYTNNYAAFWHSYFDSPMNEKILQEAGSIANKLRMIITQSFDAKANTDHSTAPVVATKFEKKKLPCDNYLYAALLYEKKLKEGLEFTSLCREAAGTYCSKKGTEFSGEQLANVFYQELKKYDNFPDFCKPEHNGQRMKRLKKEINWLQS